MTDFNQGERVLAPHPDDPSGALRPAKMYGPGSDLAVSVQSKDGKSEAVNVAGKRVVRLT